jgi:hypothetical protein
VAAPCCVTHFFLPALTFAHLLRWAALILASPFGERCRRLRPDREAALGPTLCWLALTLFHRALCAAAILRRAASDMVRRVRAEGRLLARRGIVLSAMDSRAVMARSRRSRSSRSCCMRLSRFAIARIVAREGGHGGPRPAPVSRNAGRSTPGIQRRAVGL